MRNGRRIKCEFCEQQARVDANNAYRAGHPEVPPWEIPEVENPNGIKISTPPGGVRAKVALDLFQLERFKLPPWVTEGSCIVAEKFRCGRRFGRRTYHWHFNILVGRSRRCFILPSDSMIEWPIELEREETLREDVESIDV